MLRILLALLLIPTLVFADGRKAEEIWEPFQFFVGEWDGAETGRAGTGRGERTYQFVIGDKFLLVQNRSVFEPQEKNPDGEVHEDWGIFSYDHMRAKYVFRQFHVEGFINQYALVDSVPDGKTYVFVTESIENISPGWRARLTYRVLNENEFDETFELAAPGKEFEVYLENRWSRRE